MKLFLVVNPEMKVQAVFIRKWEAEKYANQHIKGTVIESNISDEKALALLQTIANAIT